MSLDKIQESVDDIIKKINHDTAGNLKYEIRQFQDSRFKKLNNQVDNMKKLLDKNKKS